MTNIFVLMLTKKYMVCATFREVKELTWDRVEASGLSQTSLRAVYL